MNSPAVGEYAPVKESTGRRLPAPGQPLCVRTETARHGSRCRAGADAGEVAADDQGFHLRYGPGQRQQPLGGHRGRGRPMNRAEGEVGPVLKPASMVVKRWV